MSGPAGPRSPVLTDSTGVFEFTALPQVPYNLMVEKSTYLEGRFPEPGRSIRARMKPLVLRDGQVTELTVPMFHGGDRAACSTHTATRSTLPRFAYCECRVGDAPRAPARHRPTTSENTACRGCGPGATSCRCGRR